MWQAGGWRDVVRPDRGIARMIFHRVESVIADVNGIVPGLSEQPRQLRRERVIDQEFHAMRDKGRSRSIAETAANRRHSRMSST